MLKNLSSVPMHSRLFPTFSSIRFTVSGFMLRSLIHLNLSFVQGDRYGSIFILLHADIQLDQHHLLKMLSFIRCIFLASLAESCVHRHLDLLLGLQFDSIDKPVCFYANIMWGFFYYYCFEEQFEIRDGDASGSYFIIQYCFSFPWLFVCLFVCFSK